MSASDSPSTASSRFRDWWIVVAVLVILAVSSGLAFYNLSVLLAALTADGRFSVTAASGAPSLFFFASGIVGLGVAVFIERHDIRICIFAGAVTCAVALLFIGRATTLWQLYAAFVLFGAGFSASALLPGTTLITRWFVRRRSIALAIASSGLSLGGVCLTPLSAWLIQSFGLQHATTWLAALYVLCMLPALAMVRPRPAAPRPPVDGTDTSAAEAGSVATSIPFATAVRSRYFVAVTSAYACVLLSQVGAIAHLFKLASERTDNAVAATVVALMAGFSVVARLLGGWSASFIGHRSLAVGAMLGQALALALLAEADTKTALLVGVALLGMSIGNVLMLLPLLLVDAFGVRLFSRLYSVSQLITTFGVACGPLLLGVIYDLASGYRVAFWLAAGIALLAVAIMLIAGAGFRQPGAQVRW